MHGPSPKFTVTVTFEELNGKTNFTMRMVFETAELHDSTVKTLNAAKGLSQTLGRFEKYLENS
ncbi:MAG: SRPBCC domain-containing protein [Ignavibacteriaceae bacterium]